MGKGKSHKKEKRSKDKHKKHKKSKHRHRSSSVSDSSDEERFTVNKQLQMGREAARATREVLAHNHGLRKDLREVCGVAAASAPLLRRPATLLCTCVTNPQYTTCTHCPRSWCASWIVVVRWTSAASPMTSCAPAC